MGASGVAIERDGTVTLGVLSEGLRVGEVLHTVSQHIGVRCSPLQGTELHHGNEPTEIMDLCLWVLAVNEA